MVALSYSHLGLLLKGTQNMNFNGKVNMRILVGANMPDHQGMPLLLPTTQFVIVTENGTECSDFSTFRRALLICGLEKQIFKVSCINSKSYQDI